MAALKGSGGQINLTELWRPFTNFVDKQITGGPCTKLAKLRASLNVHLGGMDPDAAEAGRALKKVRKLERHVEYISPTSPLYLPYISPVSRRCASSSATWRLPRRRA